MAYDIVRVLEHVHGHLGWLAVAVLVHPAILLRHRRRRAHLAVGLAVLFTTLVGSIGMWVYGPYRDRIKQSIFIDAPWAGLLFERKEHLAFAAILLSWAGGVAYVLALRTTEPEAAAGQSLRTLAFRAFAAASVLALVVAVLGTIVASFRTF
jgi:hypothetical protein